MNSMRKLLLMNTAAGIIFNYINLFINLFIWEKGQSIADVAWYNLVQFLFWGAAFVWGVKLLNSYSLRFVFLASAIFAAITFGVVSVLHIEPKFLYLALLALPVGITNGLNSCAQNLGVSLFGKSDDFAAYFSTSNIIGQVIQIVNPIVFAIVIQTIGYTGSFAVMLGFVGVMVACAFFIPNATLASQQTKSVASYAISNVFFTPTLRWMIPSIIAAGFFMQFQGLFSLIFTFSVTENKLIIAILQITYTVCTILAMVLYRRLRNEGRFHNSFWLMLGMIMASIGFGIALYPKAPILILSNILTTVGMFFFMTIWNARQFIAINHLDAAAKSRILVWRELLLVIARIAVLAPVLAIKDFASWPFRLLMLFCFIVALTIPYLSKKGTEEVRPRN
ncbi:hypothetical protein J2Z69_000291 [Paenibacillus shirakamiensis]|uniref:MFS transporter n=1 Tax=Paenibacillus shirakamiensis TaxID=1265935 RepID=A0ABS4JC17_9BACL|nr:hypothetical protein [Paenibacillus shirakamiensis]MBP1999272.1 hypothetical protein [Paenibacillus shirakamiensis]